MTVDGAAESEIMSQALSGIKPNSTRNLEQESNKSVKIKQKHNEPVLINHNKGDSSKETQKSESVNNSKVKDEIKPTSDVRKVSAASGNEKQGRRIVKKV